MPAPPPFDHAVAGTALRVGPQTHLAEERDRLLSLTWDHFDVEPVGTTLGAEISGIDLGRDLGAAVAAELWRALVDHKVLFLRDQDLTPERLAAVASTFGVPDTHPMLERDPDDVPVLRVERGRDRTGYENAWHSDISWHPTPAAATLLHALCVPSIGGDTLFADAAAAHDGLPPELRERVDGAAAVHSFARVVAHERTEEELAELRRRAPDHAHPVVRVHPDSGRSVLYVNEYFTDRIEGSSAEESRTLLDELCAHVRRPEYHCRLRWEPGTLAFWDNRSVQHYACSDYWPAARTMQRVLVGRA